MGGAGAGGLFGHPVRTKPTKNRKITTDLRVILFPLFPADNEREHAQVFFGSLKGVRPARPSLERHGVAEVFFQIRDTATIEADELRIPG
jgi:hypothetical protein